MRLAITALVLSLVGAVTLLGSHVAHSQQRQGPKCAPVDKVIKMLREEHDEIPIAQMRDTKNIPMFIFANLETGTWTLFFLRGDEQNTLACYLDEGAGFRVGG